MRQEIGFFDQNRTGELISRLASDTSIVGKSLTTNISDGLRALASVFLFVYFFWISQKNQIKSTTN